MGEVKSPGNYVFIENKRLSDYVKLSGGYTKKADKSTVFVSYPDGSSKESNLISSPKIIDGSIIKVLAKEETVPFNFTQYVTNLTQIWSDVTQAYIMVMLLFQGGGGSS